MVSQPFVVAGREFVVTPNVGVVLGTGPAGETGATLLRDADAAMNHGKERGRGRIELFDNGMREEVLRRAEIASQLRCAVERGELALHYQPLVDVGSGRLTGFEALLRWDHPEHGIVRPDKFIDVAEETNLIAPIGRWVLGETVAQLVAWRDELPEYPITISVNLSARQLVDDALLPAVRSALAASQLEPSRLCLEITESVLMEDAEVSVATLRGLKAIGVQLAIDDFGTGYSSLTHLKRFPVDFLKIDRSFVSGVDHVPEDAVIVKAVTDLGHALGLTVIAEGVETDSQLEALRRVGCDQAQGYRWSVPCPPAEVVRLVRGWDGDLSPIAEAVASAEEATVLSSTEPLSVLTHELVTPRTVVKGQRERLADIVTGVPGAPEAVAADARGAERVEHLVATLSDAHQLEAGTLTLRTNPLDLVELVRDVVSLVVPGDRPVAVVGDPVVGVEADGRRVEQILVNLLTNAQKFSPPGSPVLVTVEVVGNRVCVVVADEGPGVPLHRVADIFRKFGRLERKTKGLGLGLFISRCLARAHGGELSYRRRLPVGSELVLHLPQLAVQPAKR